MKLNTWLLVGAAMLVSYACTPSKKNPTPPASGTMMKSCDCSSEASKCSDCPTCPSGQSGSCSRPVSNEEMNEEASFQIIQVAEENEVVAMEEIILLDTPEMTVDCQSCTKQPDTDKPKDPSTPVADSTSNDEPTARGGKGPVADETPASTKDQTPPEEEETPKPTNNTQEQ